MRISANSVNNINSLNVVGKNGLSAVGYQTWVKWCWHIVRIRFNRLSVADGWALSTGLGRGHSIGVKCQQCWRMLRFQIKSKVFIVICTSSKSVMWMQIKAVDKNRYQILFWKFNLLNIIHVPWLCTKLSFHTFTCILTYCNPFGIDTSAKCFNTHVHLPRSDRMILTVVNLSTLISDRLGTNYSTCLEKVSHLASMWGNLRGSCSHNVLKCFGAWVKTQLACLANTRVLKCQIGSFFVYLPFVNWHRFAVFSYCRSICGASQACVCRLAAHVCGLFPLYWIFICQMYCHDLF